MDINLHLDLYYFNRIHLIHEVLGAWKSNDSFRDHLTSNSSENDLLLLVLDTPELTYTVDPTQSGGFPVVIGSQRGNFQVVNSYQDIKINRWQ